MQEASKQEHGWLDSTGQQLIGKFSSGGGGNNQHSHTYTAPAGPPMGYNVILIGGPASGSGPGCRKALVWPPNSSSQLAGSAVQAVAPQTQTMQVTPAVVVNAEPATHGSSGTTNASVADEIHKLHDLHEQGILTDAEFAQAKSKLLEQP